MTPSDLIYRSQNGDEQAFGMLVRMWQERIHRFALRYVNDYDLAQDITQMTFIKVFTRLNTLDSPERFTPWIYRIALNLCIDEARRKKRLRQFESEGTFNEETDLADVLQQSDSHAFSQDRNRIIEQSLHRLPDEQRTIVLMKIFQELTFREIADILEIPENTAKARLYYAFKALGKQFKKWNLNQETI
jgi:RNA polymerase sigma-70 factor (ECF subfamily)